MPQGETFGQGIFNNDTQDDMIGALILMVLVAALIYASWRLGRDQGRKEGYIKGIHDAIDIANEILEQNEQKDKQYPFHISEQ